MKAKQRRAKKQRAKEHLTNQQERLARALRDSQALMNSNRHRSLEEVMERCGYLPDGNGGWRRLATRRHKSIDKE